MTTTTTFEKSIRYDRETRDYRAELDGQLIGFYPSYHAAEVALDQVAYDRLMDEQAVVADEAAQVDAEQHTCEARDCQLPATHTIDTTPPTHSCCFHYSEEFTGVLCPCRATTVAAAPDQPSCRGNGFGPCDQPATVGDYCPRCARFLDKVFIAAMTDRALDTVRPAATRRYWCFVDGCSYEPRHIFGDIGLCCGHYGEIAKIWCDCPDSPFNVSADPPTDPDPGPGGDPWPDAPSIFRPVVAPSLLSEADAVLLASGCAACGGRHHVQACPKIRALLLAPDAQALAGRLVERMAEAAL